MWKGLEGVMGGEKWCDYIKISRVKEKNMYRSLFLQELPKISTYIHMYKMSLNGLTLPQTP